MTIAFLWIAFAAAVAFYAHYSLGRSAAAFFFGSLFFSPLLVGLYGMASGSDIVRCPHCGEKVRKEAKVCRHCHSGLA